MFWGQTFIFHIIITHLWNLWNFLNLGEFANSSASCFFLKDTIYDFIYFSISIISLLDSLSSVCMFFRSRLLCLVWFPSVCGKLFARSKKTVSQSFAINNKENMILIFFSELIIYIFCRFLVWSWLFDSLSITGLPCEGVLRPGN